MNKPAQPCGRRRGAATVVAVALLLASWGAAAGQEVKADDLQKAAASRKEVNIEADSMEVLDEQKKAIFTGRVDAVREDVTLHADRLVVDYASAPQQDGSKKTEVSHLEATGNVVIITSRQRITGQWAKMDVKADILTVGDDVTVTQEKTVMKGKLLRVNTRTKRSELTGGRVKGSFVPSGN